VQPVVEEAEAVLLAGAAEEGARLVAQEERRPEQFHSHLQSGPQQN